MNNKKKWVLVALGLLMATSAIADVVIITINPSGMISTQVIANSSVNATVVIDNRTHGGQVIVK